MEFEVLRELDDERRGLALGLVSRVSFGLGLIFKMERSAFWRGSFGCAFVFGYFEGRLVGLGFVNNWGLREPEVTLVCENGFLSGLWGGVRDCLPVNGEKVWVINDRRNDLAASFLVETGFSFGNMERQLVLNRSLFAPSSVDGLVVRKALLSDRSLVEAFDMGVWKEIFELTDAWLLNTVLGFVGGECVAKVMVEGCCEACECGIFGLAVLPGARGRGIGRGFLSYVIRGLLDDGFGRVYLQADFDNVAANRLYEGLGFELEGELDYYSLRV